MADGTLSLVAVEGPEACVAVAPVPSPVAGLTGTAVIELVVSQPDDQVAAVTFKQVQRLVGQLWDEHGDELADMNTCPVGPWRRHHNC